MREQRYCRVICVEGLGKVCQGITLQPCIGIAKRKETIAVTTD